MIAPVIDPVFAVTEQFMPVTIAGFALMISTGLLLFWSEPVKCYRGTYFRIKVVALTLAGANALFHEIKDHDTGPWDMTFPAPNRAKLAGYISLLTWTVVIFAGRYTAYKL